MLEMFGDCTFVSFVSHDVSFTRKRNISLWNEFFFLTNGNTNFICLFLSHHYHFLLVKKIS